jgi:hypothetical protein
VGLWYDEFSQTTDEEVRMLLERAPRPPAGRPPESVHPLRGEASHYDDLVDRDGQIYAYEAASPAPSRASTRPPAARRAPGHGAPDRRRRRAPRRRRALLSPSRTPAW